MLRLSQRLSQFLRRLSAVDIATKTEGGRVSSSHIVAFDTLVLQCLLTAATRQKPPVRSRPHMRHFVVRSATEASPEVVCLSLPHNVAGFILVR